MPWTTQCDESRDDGIRVPQGIKLQQGVYASMSDVGPKGMQSNDTVVQDVVLEELRRHESMDSHSVGVIVDIGTLNETSPSQNINVSADRLTPASKKALKRAVESGDYETLIAVSVELPCEDVFIELYTYEEDPEDDTYRSINSLLLATGTDSSSIHYLTGKTVTLKRENNRWIISQGREESTPPGRVSVRDFVTPLLIALPATPLGVIAAWQFDSSLYVGAIGGLLLSFVAFQVLLYLRVATRGDHLLPGIAGRIYQPVYTDGHGKIGEDDPVTDVEKGEFRRLITLADEDEYDRSRIVLRNLAVVVDVPPMGEVTVPLPSPAQSWAESEIKQLTYHLASSVDTLDRADGTLISLKTDGDQIEVDGDDLNTKTPAQSKGLAELVGEKYVNSVNSVLGTPSREETYN